MALPLAISSSEARVMKTKSKPVSAKASATTTEAAENTRSRARSDSKLVAVLTAPFRLVGRVFFSELPLKRGAKKKPLQKPLPATSKPGSPSSRQPAPQGVDADELEMMRRELHTL